LALALHFVLAMLLVVAMHFVLAMLLALALHFVPAMLLALALHFVLAMLLVVAMHFVLAMSAMPVVRTAPVVVMGCWCRNGIKTQDGARVQYARAGGHAP
jgi:hypothetical protein